MAQRLRYGSRLLFLRSLVINVALAVGGVVILYLAVTLPDEPGADRVEWAVCGAGMLAVVIYRLLFNEMIEYVDLADWVTIKTPFGVRSLAWDQIMALQLTADEDNGHRLYHWLTVRPAHGRQVRIPLSPYEKTELLEFMLRTGRSDKVL